MNLSLILGLIAALLWLSLVIAQDDAPRYAWKLLWLPAIVVTLVATHLLILIGSLGEKRSHMVVEDRE